VLPAVFQVQRLACGAGRGCLHVIVDPQIHQSEKIAFGFLKGACICLEWPLRFIEAVASA
jgi:hypothetical protein